MACLRENEEIGQESLEVGFSTELGKAYPENVSIMEELIQFLFIFQGNH